MAKRCHHNKRTGRNNCGCAACEEWRRERAKKARKNAPRKKAPRRNRVMTNLTFNEFSPGKFYVSRKPEEPPFALMVAPRHNAGRKWGIEYRNSNEPHFGHGFQRHPASREDAERDLEKSVSVCSDYQLGLVSKPGESYEESNRE